jgi:hypothetical protein
VQIRHIDCVRCTDVAPPPAAARGESAPPQPPVMARRPSLVDRGARGCEPAARGCPRDDLRRAARLHPQSGRAGARRQPLDHPAAAALCRDDRDALGREADPRRRARTHRRRAAATGASATPAAPAGRPAALPPELVHRIRAERAAGKSFGQIARELNASRAPTAHGGAQWWPSTVRSVLLRRTRDAAPLPSSS